MKISITHEDKSHKFWQDCEVTIPDEEDIYGVMAAIEGCLLGVGFQLKTILRGFDERLEANEYNVEDNDERDTSKSLQ